MPNSSLDGISEISFEDDKDDSFMLQEVERYKEKMDTKSKSQLSNYKQNNLSPEPKMDTLQAAQHGRIQELRRDASRKSINSLNSRSISGRAYSNEPEPKFTEIHNRRVKINKAEEGLVYKKQIFEEEKQKDKVQKQKEFEKFRDAVEMTNLENGHFIYPDESNESYGSTFDEGSNFTIKEVKTHGSKILYSPSGHKSKFSYFQKHKKSTVTLPKGRSTVKFPNISKFTRKM
ncbi:unnamed protein product [Moneuplotes crassus]|uniref:Uncharacterized protein n=1 Tax=Euplotes crassus TaxID=5936 RepID=A0AAD1Y3R5_EUPCR|nr:unnamed protein product [Moneuplotes crassus]